MALTRQNSAVTYVKAVYNDPYKWSLIKSIAFFIVGVRIAQECSGTELLPSAN
ncbi:uncharacterized protein CBL_02417 [Carabus blaptoides fortunei]